MRRTFPIHCPSVRNAPGSSFGPIAISATMPIRRSSLQPMSNIGHHSMAGMPAQTARESRRPGSASLALFRRCGRAAGNRSARLDRLHLLGLGRLFRLLVFREALLERLDALGEVAHQLRNLATAAKQQKTNRQYDDPMPNAHRTHAHILHDEGGGGRTGTRWATRARLTIQGCR